jgi:predicted  nucleic acid-binding Zn-ribbon protein
MLVDSNKILPITAKELTKINELLPEYQEKLKQHEQLRADANDTVHKVNTAFREAEKQYEKLSFFRKCFTTGPDSRKLDALYWENSGPYLKEGHRDIEKLKVIHFLANLADSVNLEADEVYILTQTNHSFYSNYLKEATEDMKEKIIKLEQKIDILKQQYSDFLT